MTEPEQADTSSLSETKRLVTSGRSTTKPRSQRAETAASRASKTGRNDVDVQEKLSLIIESLNEDKADDIIVIDLVGRANFADKMVIASGVVIRQLTAMASHIAEKLRDAKKCRVVIEGDNGSGWVLIDSGDIIVHLFQPEARAHYALERMWGAELDDVSTAVDNPS